MRTIYKYELKPDCTISLLNGAQILTVQVQRDTPQLWALVVEGM